MKKSKIKCIAFDVGGVLQLGEYIGTRDCDHNVGTHEYLSKKFKKDLDSWFDSIDTVYAKSMDGGISREEAISTMAKNIGTTSSKLVKMFHKAYRIGFKRNKELFKLAFKLKKQRYKIGILSDQLYLSADVLTPKKDMKKFDPVIVSCYVGLRKPDIKIYKLFIKKSKLKAEEIVFIDNRDWNLKPARKLGMKTILFKDNKQCFRELKKLGVI